MAGLREGMEDVVAEAQFERMQDAGTISKNPPTPPTPPQ